MRHLHALPFGAMLLVAVSPYHLWAQFGGTFPAWQAHRAALIAAAVAALLGLSLRRLGCSPAKAATVAAFPVVGILFGQLGPVVPLVVGGTALLAALADAQRRYENAALALAVLGLVLFAGAFVPLARDMLRDRQVAAVEPGTRLFGSGAPGLTRTPSIIHIVLDGYGATAPLAEIYGHDTGAFFGALRRRGFTVIEDALTPYSQTLPAMASILSGAPVDLSAYSGRSGELRHDLAHTLRHGPVLSTLEAAGYTLSRSESGYGPVDFDGARIVSGGAPGMTLLEASLLRGVGAFFGPAHNRHLKDALAPGSLSQLEAPFFHYQHLLAAHPPFSLAADGTGRPSHTASFADGTSFTGGLDANRRLYIDGYREKVAFTEGALLRQIDAFPAGPKIVILHGDHGPGAFLDHESADHSCLRERMQTFVAIYSDIPGVAERLAAARPVATENIYRAVFSALTGTEIPFLAPRPRHLRWSDPTDMTPVSHADLLEPCGTAG